MEATKDSFACARRKTQGQPPPHPHLRSRTRRHHTTHHTIARRSEVDACDTLRDAGITRAALNTFKIRSMAGARRLRLLRVGRDQARALRVPAAAAQGGRHGEGGEGRNFCRLPARDGDGLVVDAEGQRRGRPDGAGGDRGGHGLWEALEDEVRARVCRWGARAAAMKHRAYACGCSARRRRPCAAAREGDFG